MKNTPKDQPLKKPRCKLVGEDGNAFYIMGRWQAAARKAGWPAEAIKKVLDEAMSGNYDHLLAVIMANSTGN